MRNFIKSYLKEFKARNISSFRRILKLLGILSIPFIYSLICISAFWNPIANVGRGEVLVINRDNTSLIFQYNSGNSKDTTVPKMGIVEDENGVAVDSSSYTNNLFSSIYSENSTYQLDTLLPKGADSNDTLKVSFRDIYKNTNEKAGNSKLIHWRFSSAWTIFKNLLIVSEDYNKTGENNDENKLYSLKFTQGNQTFNFTHINYVDFSKKEKKVDYNKYKTIITLKSGTTRDLFSIVSMISVNKKIDGDSVKVLLDKVQQIPKINIEAKYSGNYIYGYYMSSVLRFNSAVSARLLPKFFLNLQTSILYDNISFKPDNDLQIYNKNKTLSKTLFANNSYVISDYNSDWADDNKLNNGNIDEDDTLFGNVTATEQVESGTDNLARMPKGKFTEIFGFLLNSINKENYYLASELGIIPGLEQFYGQDKPDLSVFVWVLNDILFDYVHSINPFNDSTHKITVSGKEYSIQEVLKIGSAISLVLGEDFINYMKELNYKILKVNDMFLGDDQLAISADDFTNSVDRIFASFSISNPTNIPAFITDIIYKRFGNSVIFEIGGDSHYEYGLGIGLFFIVIGIFIGVFCQTFIYDRGKRIKEATAYQWYYSKSLLMCTTALVGVIFAFIGAIIGGWYVLPIGTLFAILGVLFLTAIAFTFIIQFTWYLLHDETIARLLVVIILVLNIASCGGLFPVFMQNNFFHALSYISIFKYSMHSEGLLIFNLAVTKASAPIVNELLINIFAIVLIAVTFALLGLFTAKIRNKDILFGTFINKKIAKTIEEKKLNYKFVVTRRELKLNNISRKINKIKEKIELIKSSKKADKAIEKYNQIIIGLNEKSEYIKNNENKLLDKKAYDVHVLPKVRDEVIYWDVIDKKTETKFKWYKNSYKEDVLKTNYTIYDEHEKLDRGE